MEMSNYNFTDTQKESCAVSLMRDTVKELALRDTILKRLPKFSFCLTSTTKSAILSATIRFR